MQHGGDGCLTKGKMMTEQFIYKMRAECMIDVANLLMNFLPTEIKIVHLPGIAAGVEVTFITPQTRAEVLQHIRTVQDGHVMLETCDYIALYTGDRK